MVNIIEKEETSYSKGIITFLFDKTFEPALFGVFLGLGLSTGFYIGTQIYFPQIRILPDIKLM